MIPDQKGLPTAAELNSYFDVAYGAYQQAEAVSSSPIDRFFNIGGFTIKLRFANDTLIPFMTPALEHLAIGPTTNPDLTICAWDSVSTGSVLKKPRWKQSDNDRIPETEGYIQGSIGVFLHEKPNAVELVDQDRNMGIFWIHDSVQTPYYFIGAPFVRIFNLWMGCRGLQFIHAGAVGSSEGGVLLVGKSGSGKSTASLACLDSEMFYLGDDYCLCSLVPELTIHSIYNVAKKNADDLDRLPFLYAALHNRGRLATEKALYFVAKYFPNRVLNRVPLKAILVPQITHGVRTVIEPASPMAALSVVAPSTIFQLPGSGANGFNFITKLIQQVPTYHLKVGTDIKRIPEVIEALLKNIKHAN